jgi:hypothetical protein
MSTYNPKAAWKRVVLQSRSLLKEAEGDGGSSLDPDLGGEDSVDNQIDSYLSQYEKTAKDALKESRDWRSTVKRLLKEADDEEENEEDADEEGDSEDDEGGEEGDEDAEEDTEPEKLTADDIDLNQFSNDVSRLIENYDSLLEIRNTILRRALKYLSKSYEKSATDKFKEVLLNEYGLEIGSTKRDNEERYGAPAAERAIGAGGGGGGGGI